MKSSRPHFNFRVRKYQKLKLLDTLVIYAFNPIYNFTTLLTTKKTYIAVNNIEKLNKEFNVLLFLVEYLP